MTATVIPLDPLAPPIRRGPGRPKRGTYVYRVRGRGAASSLAPPPPMPISRRRPILRGRKRRELSEELSEEEKAEIREAAAVFRGAPVADLVRRAAIALEQIRLIAQIGAAAAERACRLLDLVAEIREAYEVASSRAELVERAREMWRAALKMIGPVVTVRARDEEQKA